MERITEGDGLLSSSWLKRSAGKLLLLVGLLAFVAFCAIIIQIFARYQYVVDNGVIWRIDRFTQQTCRVVSGRTNCAGPMHSTSTSISISPSLSTSAHLYVLKKKN
ncbi:MAG: hypothetical protein JO190_01950 [Candidatus Eremiobacteraeota bacterium]|nr:hypothetical protein [Candidatus Eremiobacteraeota bacterium]MBV8499804.1 hypothetical protein [Candidatus Eremiobacteraeota bacterium]